jgi:hypothetical protein
MSFRTAIRDMPVIGHVVYTLSTAAKKQLFNPVVLFKTARYLPRFWRDFASFKHKAKSSGKSLRFKRIFPVYVDYSGSVVNKHYWFQDIYVATKIIADYRSRPVGFHHIDIGSRLEGFITSLISAGVPLTFGDINLPNVPFPNAEARFIDLQLMEPEQFDKAISVSCLHVIEHLGLGKYGDAIDPDGHRRVFADFARVLRPGTKLYISSPVSKNPGIIFNGGRHLDPKEMIESAEAAGFTVDERAIVQDDWSFVVHPTDSELNRSEYGCLILCLTKL